MKSKLLLLAGTAACAGTATAAKKAPAAAPQRPNIILILLDDSGYGDVTPYGARGYTTPNIDRMARQGMKLSDFYVSSGLSSPSRASILTGCYAERIDFSTVLFPNAKRGLNPEEVTIGDMLREQGYSTACVGKWHLGHASKEALPQSHGFDEYFGLPYSNDMCPSVYPDMPYASNSDGRAYPGLPLILGDEPIEYNPDLSQLTTRYTEYASSYIDRHKDGPFFLYLAHSMPHVPLAVSDKFKGKSQQGLYGDVLMELDWSVGQIYEALERNGIADNTWVILTSDNGPWILMGNHGGSAGPLRSGKGSTFEGGERVFCLTTWPGVIPADSECDELVTAMDFLPTMARVAGGRLPSRTIDGKDVYPLLSGQKGAKSPHEAFYYYIVGRPEAIRVGDWKYHPEHIYWEPVLYGRDGWRGTNRKCTLPPSLYNIKEDIGERHNVIDRHPEIAEKLHKMLFDFDRKMKAEVRKAVIYE